MPRPSKRRPPIFASKEERERFRSTLVSVTGAEKCTIHAATTVWIVLWFNRKSEPGMSDGNYTFIEYHEYVLGSLKGEKEWRASQPALLEKHKQSIENVILMLL